VASNTKNDGVFRRDQRNVGMSNHCRRIFRYAQQISIRRDYLSLMYRDLLAPVQRQQRIPHLQIRLLIGEKIGVEPLLFFG
jgi:hypothetical protein